jgi:hypothetical protein
MSYRKPQLTHLGDANQLIQSCGKSLCIHDNGNEQSPGAAYEADE